MTRWIIEWCVRNRFLVVLFTLMVAAAGAWGMLTIPLDAIPDLSDVQDGGLKRMTSSSSSTRRGASTSSK